MHIEKNNLKCTYRHNSELAVSAQESDLGNIMISLAKSLAWCSGAGKKSQQNVDCHQERC